MVAIVRRDVGITGPRNQIINACTVLLFLLKYYWYLHWFQVIHCQTRVQYQSDCLIWYILFNPTYRNVHLYSTKPRTTQCGSLENWRTLSASHTYWTVSCHYQSARRVNILTCFRSRVCKVTWSQDTIVMYILYSISNVIVMRLSEARCSTIHPAFKPGFQPSAKCYPPFLILVTYRSNCRHSFPNWSKV